VQLVWVEHPNDAVCLLEDIHVDFRIPFRDQLGVHSLGTLDQAVEEEVSKPTDFCCQRKGGSLFGLLDGERFKEAARAIETDILLEILIL
jgi:hypothetical protein